MRLLIIGVFWRLKLKFFCPFCGAPDEELTYSFHYDKIIRRDVADIYCNKCGKSALIIIIKETSIQGLNYLKV